MSARIIPMTTPEATEAEQSALGCVLFDNGWMEELRPMLEPRDFFGPREKYIWQSMVALHSAGMPIDETTLAQHLKERSRLDAAGGIVHLAELVDIAPVTANALVYGRMVRGASLKRQMIEQAEAARDAITRNNILEATDAQRKFADLRDLLLDVEEGRESRRASRAFKFDRSDTIELKPPDWLIRDLLETNCLAEVFGDPRSGKSFLALDWSCSIALGLDFMGHPVKQGPVLYIAGEGRSGIKRRIRAWEIAREQSTKGAPLYLSRGPALLCDPAAGRVVSDAVDAVADADAPPVLVVVDTLARNFGGDENNAQDMGAFVDAVGAIQTRHGCTVLIVHHTGHQAKERARGSMSLKAALDTEYSMSRDDDGIARLNCTKQKDAPEPPPVAFEIRQVELDILDDDRPATSAVLIPVAYVEIPKRGSQGKVGKGKNQMLALDILNRLYQAQVVSIEKSGGDITRARVLKSEWRAACVNEGLPRERTYDIEKSLNAAQQIIVDGNHLIPG